MSNLPAEARGRLTKSKEAQDVESREAGKELGTFWAQESAGYRELERIAYIGDRGAICDGDGAMRYRFFEAVQGINSADYCDGCVDEFWSDLFGDVAVEAQTDPEMVRGFIDAATSVWVEYHRQP